MLRRRFLQSAPAVTLFPQLRSAPRLKITDIRIINLKTVRETGKMEAAWNPGTVTTHRIGGGFWSNRDIGAFHATQLPSEPAIFSLANQSFSGDGLVVPYVGDARTTKETTMKLTAITSRSAFTIDHDEWISCSHWGMFPLRRKSSNWRGEA